jgi:hypothetical protein
MIGLGVPELDLRRVRQHLAVSARGAVQRVADRPAIDDPWLRFEGRAAGERDGQDQQGDGARHVRSAPADQRRRHR